MFGMTKVKGPQLKSLKRIGTDTELAHAAISARAFAGLTQEQLAERMDTKQSVIARLEGGRPSPSIKTLRRLAAATGTRLRIAFEPLCSPEE
jgi:transcriptional regulator with XRE-family HTH domain